MHEQVDEACQDGWAEARYDDDKEADERDVPPSLAVRHAWDDESADGEPSDEIDADRDNAGCKRAGARSARLARELHLREKGPHAPRQVFAELADQVDLRGLAEGTVPTGLTAVEEGWRNR